MSFIRVRVKVFSGRKGTGGGGGGGGGGGTIVRRDWGRIWKKEGGNTYMIVNNYVRVCFILNRCKYSLTEQKR